MSPTSRRYGLQVYGLEVVPMLVCAVAVGNVFPVVEMPRAPEPAEGASAAPTGGYYGKPIVSRAHAHVAVVSGGQTDPHDVTLGPYLPCEPQRWDAEKTYMDPCPLKVEDFRYLRSKQTQRKRPPV